MCSFVCVHVHKEEAAPGCRHLGLPTPQEPVLHSHKAFLGRPKQAVGRRRFEVARVLQQHGAVPTGFSRTVLQEQVEMHFKLGELSGSDGGQSAGSKPGLQAVQGGKSLLLLTTPAASRPPGAPPLARHRPYAPVSPSAVMGDAICCPEHKLCLSHAPRLSKLGTPTLEAWLPDSPLHTQCSSL